MSAQETPPIDDLFADLDELVSIGDELRLDAEEGLDRDGRWHIATHEQAEWAMGKLAAARQQVAELTAQRDAYMERAQDWFARMVSRPRQTIGFMDAHLQDFALRERQATGGRVKTVVLPSGEIPTRKGSAECAEIDDAETVTGWALKAHPEIVRHSVNVTDVRKHVAVAGEKVVDTASGEVVPGMTVRPEGDPTATPKPF